MKLTDRQAEFLERVHLGRHLRIADREEDRVRQFVRKHGLALVVMNPRRWVVTADGRAALAERSEG